jgi:hypothetical protein
MTDLAAADVRGVTDPPVDYQKAPPVVTHFYNPRLPVLAASAVLATATLLWLSWLYEVSDAPLPL